MLPSNTNFSNFADHPSFYTLHEQTFDSQPQMITEPPAIEAASFAMNTCQQLRKRTGRADRHSKIRTAHGERDRRMRLSVQVAQEFFALQDKLGFDKASKTIDWLLTQAKDSIDQLTSTGSSSEQHPKQKFPTDDHHTVFTDDYQSVLQFPDHHHPPVHGTEIAESTIREGECQLKAKDLRAKARARARERAKEKMKVASTGQPDQLVPAADSTTSTTGSYSSMEYYYFLLNEILNGGFCGVDFDDNEEGNTSSAGAQFY